jgi:hypothetical protein
MVDVYTGGKTRQCTPHPFKTMARLFVAMHAFLLPSSGLCFREYGMEVDDSRSSHFIRSLHSCTSRYTSYSITSVLFRFLHLSPFLPCSGLQVISGAASSSAEAAASPTETFPDNPSVAS